MSDESQVAEEEKLPLYVIEGARSSRSRCKVCRRAISKDTLRLGVLIEGPYGTGYLWHHLTCAARRKLENVEEAYELEAWNEAKTPPDKVPSLDELRRVSKEADERKKQRKQIPYAEPAPSGRAKCKHCEQTVDKGSVRVVLGRGVYFGSQIRTAPINVHPRCVAAELKSEDCTTEIEGFEAALRTNSADLSADVLDSLIAGIGQLT
jgi:hypothetical protein